MMYGFIPYCFFHALLHTLICFITGDLGCSIDALPFLDKACSDKPSCNYHVGNPDLLRTKPCSSDGNPYLELNYECIQGT